MSRLFLSATRKSSGKTTIAVGLCAAFAKRGRLVRPFKKGPDYIDPMWLSRAAGNPCINLDFHTMSADEIRTAYHRYGAGDLAVIEGNKGLFDGLDPAGSDSNAALAKVLDAPVLLVLDAQGMTRGVAPLLLGYASFDPTVKISGVILNNVGGARHESKLRAAVENYTDIAVVGAVHADPDLKITERHLGLVPAKEHAAKEQASEAAAADVTDNVIENITRAVTAQVDIDAVVAIAESAAPLASCPPPTTQAQPANITIAIARDAAFGFYYADDLDAFETHGAQLLPFDAMNDATLPAADGLYIGGGFPETNAAALSRNAAMRTAVKNFVARGGPVYAECGGLMYLAQSLTWSGRTWDMAGALPVRVEMTDRPVGRGYVVLRETAHGLWPPDDDGNNQQAAAVPAHEFHYSRPTGLADDARFAYRVERGYGIDGRFDGLVHGNTLANYSHFRNTAANPWVKRFVNFVSSKKHAHNHPKSREKNS